MRDSKGRFKKGYSGNPSGRPKGAAGAADYIKDKTKNMTELIDIALDLVRKEDTKTDDKVKLLKFLASYGIGTPTQHSVIEGDMKIDIGVPEEIEDALE